MKRYITILSGLLLTAAASAQNLNPTVQVTNAYEGKLMEVEKQNVSMAVPDSLTQFDWKFNYSVFDNPYKGAYEFNPYVIEMRPEPVPFDGKDLYVRAGLGYTLHPEVQAVWTPEIKGRFGISVYDDFKGYWGPYHGMDGVKSDDGGYTLESVGKYDGSDAGNRFGVNTSFVTNPVVFTLDGTFDWLNAMGNGDDRNRATGEGVVFRARTNGIHAFTFDASAGMNWLYNKTSSDKQTAAFDFRERALDVDLTMSYSFTENVSIGVLGYYNRFNFTEQPGVQASDLLDIGPVVTYDGDRASISVGFKYSDVWKDYALSKEYSEFPDMYYGIPAGFSPADYEGKKFYPHLKAGYEVAEDVLVIFADVTGGQHFNSYSSFLDRNHYIPSRWSALYSSRIGDASVNTFDGSLGMKGRITSRFQYKVDAGYARWFNVPLEGVMAGADNLVFAYSMSNYDLKYADLDIFWKNDRIDASGSLRYQDAKIKRGPEAFTLPRFKGSADFTYNWNRRIYAGLYAEWATRRERVESLSSDAYVPCTAPGWVDLGLNLEFKVNNRFSAWLNGGNLLNQTVMRNLMFAQKGPYVTAGISFSL